MEPQRNPESREPLRVLVTGAGSYVGTSFAGWLGRHSGRYKVDTLDMLDPGWREHPFSGYDAVYHVAGIAHVTADPSKADLYRRVNTELAVETARKAKDEGVPQFIFMSSAIVYGQDDPVGTIDPIRRDTRPNPADVYGRSKWEAEQGIAALADDSFTVSILRSPVVYGPGSRGNFPRLLRLARRCPVFPAAGARRSMIYIDHLCEFVRLVIEHRAGGLFFPQDAEPVDPSEVVREYRRQTGRRTWMVRGLVPLLRFAGRYVRGVGKLFGSKVYDPALSAAPGGGEYRSLDFPETIRRCRAAMDAPAAAGSRGKRR